MNDAFKKASAVLVGANVPAKIVKDAIHPYRSNFLGGNLWQRLVSMFRKQLKARGSFDFARINAFEIHEEYPFDRFLRVQPTIKPDVRKSILRVTISYDSHPRFPKVEDVDGYRLTVIGIFPDLKKKTAKTVAIESNVIGLKGAVAALQTQLDVPKKAKSYIVCIKIDGCIKGKVGNMRSTCGMRVIASGLI